MKQNRWCPICNEQTTIGFPLKDPPLKVRVCHGCKNGEDAAEVLAEFIEDELAKKLDPMGDNE